MRIGELASHSGMKADTVRYYEKTGLLPAPPRLPNGYRDYGPAHVERPAFIRHCRTLGMSLDDVHRCSVSNPAPDLVRPRHPTTVHQLAIDHDPGR